MDTMIERHTGKLHYVGIERDIPGTVAMWGFILDSSPELVLLHNVEDFHLDGYRILRTADVRRVRHSKYERAMERMLRAEGVTPEVGLAEAVGLDSWHTAFQSLKALGQNIIVEGEDSAVDRFLVGRIARVNRKSVTMREFDATGEWLDTSVSCPYSLITSVGFGSEYVTVFSKYV